MALHNRGLLAGVKVRKDSVSSRGLTTERLACFSEYMGNTNLTCFSFFFFLEYLKGWGQLRKTGK